MPCAHYARDITRPTKQDAFSLEISFFISDQPLWRSWHGAGCWSELGTGTNHSLPAWLSWFAWWVMTHVAGVGQGMLGWGSGDCNWPMGWNPDLTQGHSIVKAALKSLHLQAWKHPCELLSSATRNEGAHQDTVTHLLKPVQQRLHALDARLPYLPEMRSQTVQLWVLLMLQTSLKMFEGCIFFLS